MASNHRYESLKQGEEAKDEINNETIYTTTPAVKSWWKFLLSNLAAACVGAAVMFFVVNMFSPRPYNDKVEVSPAGASTNSSADVEIPGTPSLKQLEEEILEPNMSLGTILDCGYSAEEARAKDCVYDVMMQDWVPKPCYDESLTERYLKDGNWTWYADGEGLTTMTDEEMRTGEHRVAWMSASYHKAHCVFSWIKIIRAMRNNRGISQELLSYDHVLHCAHGALKECPQISENGEEAVSVSAPTNYAKCALYNTWKMDFIPDKHNSTD